MNNVCFCSVESTMDDSRDAVHVAGTRGKANDRFDRVAGTGKIDLQSRGKHFFYLAEWRLAKNCKLTN